MEIFCCIPQKIEVGFRRSSRRNYSDLAAGRFTVVLNQIMEAHPRLGYRVIREIARIEAQRLRRTN